MLKSLTSRRMIGFIISAVMLWFKPELETGIAILYSALVGVAMVDSFKGRN